MFGLLYALALSGPAQARVFNWKEATLAAYVRGTGGTSALGKNAFAASLGTGESVDATSALSYGGEIGAFFAFTPSVHVRIGAELLQSRSVGQAPGVNASGTELYRLNSTVSAFNPNVTLEFSRSSVGILRYFGYLGAGYATASVQNQFTMTAAGTSADGVNDFNEVMAGHAISGALGAGAEILFTDNATCVLDIGYRYMRFSNLKYTGDATTINPSAGVQKGDAVLGTDGQPRVLDLSGVTVGVAFRFYLNFL